VAGFGYAARGKGKGALFLLFCLLTRGKGGKALKVLIAEYNEVNRILLRDILALLDVEVIEASDGEEAIKLSRAKSRT
jgi:hypothetical protein